MSTDLENLTANFGLLKREFRDVHAVVSRLDTQVRRLVEPVAIHRPAGLVGRYAACTLIALKAKRSPEAIATQHFAADRDLARLPWNFTKYDSSSNSVGSAARSFYSNTFSGPCRG